MDISSNFFKLLEKIEGKENNVYLDSGGAPTIGIGHLLTDSERFSGKIYIGRDVFEYKYGLSDEQVYALCKSDVKKAVKSVNKYVKVPLSQNQFDALVSFVFNVGDTAFKNSTLLRLLNNGEYDEVPAQLRRWKYDNGKVVQGLINRREQEVEEWKK